MEIRNRPGLQVSLEVTTGALNRKQQQEQHRAQDLDYKTELNNRSWTYFRASVTKEEFQEPEVEAELAVTNFESMFSQIAIWDCRSLMRPTGFIDRRTNNSDLVETVFLVLIELLLLD
ncbi:hypothetical protein Tco_0490963 [Tanacetum coccineum]